MNIGLVSNDERDQRFNKAVDTNRYMQLKEHRENLRSEYIKKGILDDPNAKMSLTNARAIVGTCLKMCPEFEAEEREYQKGLDKLEMIPGTEKVDRNAAVKTYHRSAAGNEQPLPEDIRTPETLSKTMDYLINKILASDEKMCDSHQFIRDRTRSIRQDFSLQNIRDIRSIKVYERIARYHILSVHMLSEESFFSEAQEMEQLKKTLQSLLEFYDEARLKSGSNSQITENESEMRAYHLLAHMRSMDGRLLAERLPDSIFWSPIFQQSLKLTQLAQCSNSLIGRNEPPNLDCAQNFFTTFFKQVKSNKTPYLLACVAEFHFVDIRRSSLKALNKSIHYQENFEYPTPKLTEILGFDSINECVEFCTAYSLKSNELTTGLGQKFRKVYVMIEPELKPKRKKNILILEKKRVGLSNSDIVNFNSISSTPLRIDSPISNPIPQATQPNRLYSKILLNGVSKPDIACENKPPIKSLALNAIDKEKLKSSFNLAKSETNKPAQQVSVLSETKNPFRSTQTTAIKSEAVSFDFSKAFPEDKNKPSPFNNQPTPSITSQKQTPFNPPPSFSISNNTSPIPKSNSNTEIKNSSTLIPNEVKKNSIGFSFNSNLSLAETNSNVNSLSFSLKQPTQPLSIPITTANLLKTESPPKNEKTKPLFENPISSFSNPNINNSFPPSEKSNNQLHVSFGKKRENISLTEISKNIYNELVSDIISDLVTSDLLTRKKNYSLFNELTEQISENLFEHSIYSLTYQMSFSILYKEKADEFYKDRMVQYSFSKWLSNTRKIIYNKTKIQKQKEIVSSLLSKSDSLFLKSQVQNVNRNVLHLKPVDVVSICGSINSYVNEDLRSSPYKNRLIKQETNHTLRSKVLPTEIKSQLWESASLGQNMCSVLESLTNFKSFNTPTIYSSDLKNTLVKSNIAVWCSSDASLAMRWFWWQLDSRLDQFNNQDRFEGVARFLCDKVELNFCEGEFINSNLKSLEFEPDAHIIFLESPSRIDSMQYWNEFNLMLEKISVFSDSYLNEHTTKDKLVQPPLILVYLWPSENLSNPRMNNICDQFFKFGLQLRLEKNLFSSCKVEALTFDTHPSSQIAESFGWLLSMISAKIDKEQINPDCAIKVIQNLVMDSFERISTSLPSIIYKIDDVSEFSHYELINVLSNIINSTFSSESQFIDLLSLGYGKKNIGHLPKMQFKNRNDSIYDLFTGYCTNPLVLSFTKPAIGYEQSLLDEVISELTNSIQYPISFVSISLYTMMKSLKKIKHFVNSNEYLSLKKFLIVKSSIKEVLIDSELSSSICVPSLKTANSTATNGLALVVDNLNSCSSRKRPPAFYPADFIKPRKKSVSGSTSLPNKRPQSPKPVNNNLYEINELAETDKVVPT
ncbi:SAC3 family protein 1 [Smittium culicis]|uniref:SAC3 family protein 1 n=1 Tax=Smittium culicis TaxID=133412 RepID=A0A1R1YR27_9FUNG|nr:SAC3 family protein 1 [Smittium culicis]